MTAPANEASLQRALDAWNTRDLDGYLTLYDDAIRLHGYSPEPMDKSAVRGFYAMIHQAFDGPKLVFHDVFGSGDRLVVRFTMTGTHRADFIGIAPTGRSVAVDGITILHFKEGKCVERWSSVDMYAWLAQLGAVPPLGAG
jgi:Predicted ester cyclase